MRPGSPGRGVSFSVEKELAEVCEAEWNVNLFRHFHETLAPAKEGISEG